MLRACTHKAPIAAATLPCGHLARLLAGLGALFDRSAERRERELGNLEELLPKWNANDRDAPETPDQEVAKRHPPAVNEEPDDIDQE